MDGESGIVFQPWANAVPAPHGKWNKPTLSLHVVDAGPVAEDYVNARRSVVTRHLVSNRLRGKQGPTMDRIVPLSSQVRHYSLQASLLRSRFLYQSKLRKPRWKICSGLMVGASCELECDALGDGSRAILGNDISGCIV